MSTEISIFIISLIAIQDRLAAKKSSQKSKRLGKRVFCRFFSNGSFQMSNDINFFKHTSRAPITHQEKEIALEKLEKYREKT